MCRKGAQSSAPQIMTPTRALTLFASLGAASAAIWPNPSALTNGSSTIVVAPGEAPLPDDVVCFLASGQQGVQFDKGVWHHPLLDLQPRRDFLVVDGNTDGPNLEERNFDDAASVLIESGSNLKNG